MPFNRSDLQRQVNEVIRFGSPAGLADAEQLLVDAAQGATTGSELEAIVAMTERIREEQYAVATESKLQWMQLSPAQFIILKRLANREGVKIELEANADGNLRIALRDLLDKGLVSVQKIGRITFWSLSPWGDRILEMRS
jgi:hypothetical protein